MDLVYSNKVQFGDLSEADAARVAYLRVSSRGANNSLTTIGRYTWSVDELRRLGVQLPDPPTHEAVCDAFAGLARRMIEGNIGGGQTIEFQVRLMEAGGTGAVRSMTTRVTRPQADDEPALTTDTPPAPSVRLAENDATAATPGMRAVAAAYEHGVDVFHKMTNGATGFMERMESLHERHYKRLEGELERERANHQRTVDTHAAERKEWAEERKSLNDQLVVLASLTEDGGGEKKLSLEDANKSVDELKKLLGPLAPLVAGQLPPHLAAVVNGGDTAGGGPGDQLLATLMASIPPDKLAKLTPDFLSAKLKDRATIDTIISLLGV